MTLRRLFTSSRLRLMAWVLFFALMLLGGYHRYYIAAWQLPIIAGGAAILLLVFVIDLLTLLLQRRPAAPPREEGTRFTRLMETLAHCLPLFVFLSVGVSELTGSPLTGGDSARAARALARAEGTAAITGPLGGAAGYQQISLLQLFTASEHSDNAAVEIEGRIYKTEGQEVGWLDPGLGGDKVEALLYRYMISCCVADAMPLSVVLTGADVAGLKQQGWVRVRGRLSPGPDGASLAIAVESIEPIKAPGHPYLTLYDTLLGEGGAMDLQSSHDDDPQGAAGEVPDLTLDPANPENDPLKDYAWPGSEGAAEGEAFDGAEATP